MREHSPDPWCHDDASPYIPSVYVFSGSIGPLDNVSLGRLVLWTMHPLNDSSYKTMRPWPMCTAHGYNAIKRPRPTCRMFRPLNSASLGRRSHYGAWTTPPFGRDCIGQTLGGPCAWLAEQFLGFPSFSIIHCLYADAIPNRPAEKVSSYKNVDNYKECFILILLYRDIFNGNVPTI